MRGFFASAVTASALACGALGISLTQEECADPRTWYELAMGYQWRPDEGSDSGYVIFMPDDEVDEMDDSGENGETTPVTVTIEEGNAPDDGALPFTNFSLTEDAEAFIERFAPQVDETYSWKDTMAISTSTVLGDGAEVLTFGGESQDWAAVDDIATTEWTIDSWGNELLRARPKIIESVWSSYILHTSMNRPDADPVELTELSQTLRDVAEKMGFTALGFLGLYIPEFDDFYNQFEYGDIQSSRDLFNHVDAMQPMCDEFLAHQEAQGDTDFHVVLMIPELGETLQATPVLMHAQPAKLFCMMVSFTNEGFELVQVARAEAREISEMQ